MDSELKAISGEIRIQIPKTGHIQKPLEVRSDNWQTIREYSLILPQKRDKVREIPLDLQRMVSSHLLDNPFAYINPSRRPKGEGREQ